MNIHFKALADHSHRVSNIIVRIEQKFLREHVQRHNAVLGKSDIAGGVHGQADVLAIDVPRTISQCDSAAAVHPAHMAAGYAGDSAFDGHVRNTFGLFDSSSDGGCCRADIRNQSLAQAL